MMLKNNLVIAFRNLVRHKVHSSMDILGLGVGMACAILIASWVHYEWSFDRFHEHADRLYRVVFTAVTANNAQGYYQPGPLAAELQARFPEILHATNFSEFQTKVSFERRGFFCNGSLVDSSFFEMFSFPLERGDARNVLTRYNAIVISHSLARKIFGSGDPVGRPLRLFDQMEFVVTGVFRDVPEISHIQFDYLLSSAIAPEFMKMWDRKCVNTYVLLQKNCSPDEVNGKIAGVMNEHNPTWQNVLSLVPMTRIHLYDLRGGGLITSLYAFSLLAFLVLLVACINVTNLLTARAESRAKEIGIRKAVGSSRRALAGQFLVETLAVSCASLLVAVLLAETLLPFLNGVLNTRISFVYSASTVAALLGLAVATGLVAGSYPAWLLSSFSPMAMLTGKVGEGAARRSLSLRRVLVIAQFAFSIFIMTCVFLVRGQLSFVQSKYLGFEKDNVLMIRTSGALQAQSSIVKDALAKLPKVLGASVSADNLITLSNTGPIEWDGMVQGRVVEVAFNSVDEDFARTFQLNVTQGRFFSREFPSDGANAFVVNEEAVREMNLENPVGKRLKTWMGREGRIVGVIKDFHVESLHEQMTPVVFTPTSAANFLCVRIAPGDISATIQAIGAAIKGIVPDDPFEYHFLDADIDRLYRTEQTTSALGTSVAVLAIILSCLGLVGLISFTTRRRTKEIGIRKVVGASVSGILVMLTRDFASWVVLANLVAWPLAFYAMRAWLQDFAYRIELTVWPFLAAGGATLLIALVVVSLQALRAATANPVDALRYE